MSTNTMVSPPSTFSEANKAPAESFTTTIKHPLEDTKSWRLFIQRQQEQQQHQPQQPQQQQHTQRMLHDSNGITNDDDSKNNYGVGGFFSFLGVSKHKKSSTKELEEEEQEQHDHDEIHVTHSPYKHKIPKADGDSMHGMMIDAGSVSKNFEQLQRTFHTVEE
jgi:hypothetical protein